MLTNDDLQSIEKLLDRALDIAIDPVKDELRDVKNRLGSVETRLEKVENRLDTVANRLETVEIKVELLNKKIDSTQKDTIAALTDVIHTGYNLHEERIVKIEEQLKTSQAH